MEVLGSLNAAQGAALPDFCTALCQELAELVRQIVPAITPRDLSKLPLLTLGAQLQGANNNIIGREATAGVFLAIAEIVQPYVEQSTSTGLLIRNASGRVVHIVLASDPDISIIEESDGVRRNKVAIEIKGGMDKSNTFNRAGEAEKSHRQAQNAGFRDFWTLSSKVGLNYAKLQASSPTTRSWFEISHVLGRDGADWQEFRSRLAGEIGIPLVNAG